MEVIYTCAIAQNWFNDHIWHKACFINNAETKRAGGEV
jgi:hypothetical protein